MVVFDPTVIVIVLTTTAGEVELMLVISGVVSTTSPPEGVAALAGAVISVGSAMYEVATMVTPVVLSLLAMLEASQRVCEKVSTASKSAGAQAERTAATSAGSSSGLLQMQAVSDTEQLEAAMAAEKADDAQGEKADTVGVVCGRGAAAASRGSRDRIEGRMV